MYPKNYKNENKVVSTNVFTKKINPWKSKDYQGFKWYLQDYNSLYCIL